MTGDPSEGPRTRIVGCADTCDVRVIADPYISGHHAKFTFTDEGIVLVEDMGSTNGTFIQRYGKDRPAHPCLLPRVTHQIRFLPGDTLWLSRETAIPWDQPPWTYV